MKCFKVENKLEKKAAMISVFLEKRSLFRTRNGGIYAMGG